MEPNDYLNMSKGVMDMAILLHEYKEALFHAGFTTEEAYDMTVHYQDVITTVIWGNLVKANDNE